MNLQALYDLKERLEYAAVAGTGLMQEDFRLRRAVDALVPLAAASPVFGKISTAAKALLAAPQEERSTRLLDVLSLVDAVVYTQGVTNISGPVEPMERGTGKYVQASYGELQPLLTALSGSGSGRTSLIQKCYAEHPEYFTDFRVLPHVVKALGDNYAEFADLIGRVLIAWGEGIIPTLKEGFDPAGKAEMARRVRLIAKISGGTENDWFLSMLPESKKDVRLELIQALSLSQENVQILLDLCRTERAKAREMALRSLAAMNQVSARNYWSEEARKKPDSVFCLAGVQSMITADLAAISFRALLERILMDAESVNRKEIFRVLDTVSGNYSQALAEVWRWAAGYMDEFHQRIPGHDIRGHALSGAELLQETMMETILLNPAPEVLALAAELAGRNRKWFLCGVVMADIERLTPEEHFAKFSHLIVPDENEDQRNDRIQILQGLGKVRWMQEKQCYALCFLRADHDKGQNVQVFKPLAGFDIRWLALLTRPDVRQYGQILSMRSYTEREDFHFWLLQMIRPDDAESCRIIGSWLYLKLKLTGKLQPYASGLIYCGWKNWKGVLAYCAGQACQLMYHQCIHLLAEMPISNREKAEELRELDALASSGRVSVWNQKWPKDRVWYLISRLENEENVNILQEV